MKNKDYITQKLEDTITKLQTVFDDSTLGDIPQIKEDINSIIKDINNLF